MSTPFAADLHHSRRRVPPPVPTLIPPHIVEQMKRFRYILLAAFGPLIITILLCCFALQSLPTVILLQSLHYYCLCFSSHTSSGLLSSSHFLLISILALGYACVRYLDAWLYQPSTKKKVTLAIVILVLNLLYQITLFSSTYSSTSLLWLSFSLLSVFWIPTSLQQLQEAEDTLLRDTDLAAGGTYSGKRAGLSYLHFPCTKSSIKTNGHAKDIAACNETGKPLTIVFLPGYGGGKLYWFLNLPTLRRYLDIYTLDLRGCGISDGDSLHGRSAAEAEQYFVESLEQWRKEVGLQSFILAGHSFGGYIASVYALQYPQYIQQLILVSPVGLPVPPPINSQARTRGRQWPSWFKNLMVWFWNRHITISNLLQFFGLLAPYLAFYLLRKRFLHVKQSHMTHFINYTYYLNSIHAPGQKALNILLAVGAWAHLPLLPRLKEIHIPTTFLYGEKDWMEAECGHEIVEGLKARGLPAHCLIVERAGHQLAMVSVFYLYIVGNSTYDNVRYSYVCICIYLCLCVYDRRIMKHSMKLYGMLLFMSSIPCLLHNINSMKRQHHEHKNSNT